MSRAIPVLMIAAVLALAGPATAAQRSDTVHIDPGQHAALEVDFTDGPTMDVTYEVTVTEGPNIDVLVMDNANYQKYQDGESFEHAEEWSDLDTGRTDLTFTLREHGTWWVVLDHTGEPDGGNGPGVLGGEPATARYTIGTNVNFKEEAKGIADAVPSPNVLLVAGLVGLAAVVASRR